MQVFFVIFWPLDKLETISPRFLCSVGDLESLGFARDPVFFPGRVGLEQAKGAPTFVVCPKRVEMAPPRGRISQLFNE